jgi:nucleoid-associated protein YgaU
MAISIYSRYADNQVIPITNASGVTKSTIIIKPPNKPTVYGISTYTWQLGDQIDYLSFSAYGDETQWWRIADANPEILFWNNIAPGAQVRIPSA